MKFNFPNAHAAVGDQCDLIEHLGIWLINYGDRFGVCKYKDGLIGNKRDDWTASEGLSGVEIAAAFKSPFL